MRVSLFFSVLLIASSAARAETTPYEVMLLQDVGRYNSQCRGGSGNDLSTWQACGARDYLFFLLDVHGWCFGKQTDFGSQMEWHRCTSNSNRAMKPIFSPE